MNFCFNFARSTFQNNKQNYRHFLPRFPPLFGTFSTLIFLSNCPVSTGGHKTWHYDPSGGRNLTKYFGGRRQKVKLGWRGLAFSFLWFYLVWPEEEIVKTTFPSDKRGGGLKGHCLLPLSLPFIPPPNPRTDIRICLDNICILNA